MDRFRGVQSWSWLVVLALWWVGVVTPACLEAQGEITGRVVSRSDRQPLAAVQVVVLESGAETLSDEEGKFGFPAVAVGTYSLEARLSGFVVERIEGVEVVDGEATDVLFELVPASPTLDEIVVTPSQFSLLRREPVGGEFLTGVEIDRMPHLSDDLFRAVGRLPGVSGGDISARFNIRGGEEDEVLVLIDGLEIYEPFHLKDFQSVFSIVDSEAVGGVDFMTGGFSAEYGDRMSGVLDITTASPPDRRHTELGISFINARVLSQGTIGDDKGEWLVSARRGYLDIVLDFVDPGGEFDPTYYDALGKYQRTIGEGTTLSGNLLAAYDDVLFDSEDDDERADASYGNAYAWLNLSALMSPRALSRTVISVGRVERDRSGGVDNSGTQSQVRDERDFDVFALRQDWSLQLGRRHYLKAGVEARSFEAHYDYRSRSVFSDPFITGGGPPVVVERESFLEPSGESYGAYLADRIRLFAPLTVELGVRWDQQTYLEPEDDQVSPRANLVYQIGQRTALRAGWGRFHQSQRIHELQVEDGVDTFFPAQRSEHQVISLEHAFKRGLTLRLEAYRKEITDVRPRFENLFDPIEIFPEAEADRVAIAPERAEAEGLEVTVRHSGRGPVHWWATYILSSAEDRIDGEWVPRSWDQEHAFQLGVNYRPGEKWNFNLYGIYHTGWPTTGVTARLEQAPDGSLVIVPSLGPRNGERFDDFHRLDFRASRKVEVGKGSFAFFIEVLNLLNRENPCCVDDFSFTPRPDGTVEVRRSEDYWLPIIPSFGFAWEF